MRERKVVAWEVKHTLNSVCHGIYRQFPWRRLRVAFCLVVKDKKDLKEFVLSFDIHVKNIKVTHCLKLSCIAMGRHQNNGHLHV